MQFEWDEAKNTLNQVKHGISFEIAQEVFLIRSISRSSMNGSTTTKSDGSRLEK
jgi:uncharacterized DUF497 family protein